MAATRAISGGQRFYHVSTRTLGGGNIQLHKGNNSNTAGAGFFQLEEWQMCGDLNAP